MNVCWSIPGMKKPMAWNMRKEEAGSNWFELRNQLLYKAEALKGFNKNLYPFTLHSTLKGVIIVNFNTKQKQNLQFNEPNFLFQKIQSKKYTELCYAGKTGEIQVFQLKGKELKN